MSAEEARTERRPKPQPVVPTLPFGDRPHFCRVCDFMGRRAEHGPSHDPGTRCFDMGGELWVAVAPPIGGVAPAGGSSQRGTLKVTKPGGSSTECRVETDRESAERYERERKEAHEQAERERKEERERADLRRAEDREQHDRERRERQDPS